MTNLLTQRDQFTPPAGEFVIGMKKHPTHVEVAGTDSGQGISADFLPYIFDTLRQEDAGLQPACIRDWGLGLAIAKRVIEMHGGKHRGAVARAKTKADVYHPSASFKK
jgi:K+-sensing histidine kinase KdpD